MIDRRLYALATPEAGDLVDEIHLLGRMERPLQPSPPSIGVDVALGNVEADYAPEVVIKCKRGRNVRAIPGGTQARASKGGTEPPGLVQPHGAAPANICRAL